MTSAWLPADLILTEREDTLHLLSTPSRIIPSKLQGYESLILTVPMVVSEHCLARLPANVTHCIAVRTFLCQHQPEYVFLMQTSSLRTQYTLYYAPYPAGQQKYGQAAGTLATDDFHVFALEWSLSGEQQQPHIMSVPAELRAFVLKWSLS